MAFASPHSTSTSCLSGIYIAISEKCLRSRHAVFARRPGTPTSTPHRPSGVAEVSFLDSQHLHKNPFLEISTFPPTLAYSGTLPPSFDLVLKALGCTKSKAPKLITSIRRDLTTYLKEAWCTYISLCANIPAANIPAADILAANIPAANIPPANIPATFIPAANVLATNIPAANIPVTNNPASVIPTANTLAANIPATSIPALPPFPHEGIPLLSRISHALPMMPPRTASSPASPLITQYSGAYPASSTHQQHTTAHTP